MKIKKIILSCGLIAIVSSVIVVTNNFVQADNDDLAARGFKNNVKALSEIKKSTANEGNKGNTLAIQTALNDFSSLKEFNEYFPNGAGTLKDNGDGTSTAPSLTDEQWLVPDTTPEGSNDGGKTHGWTISESRKKATDSTIRDINTGEVTDTIKASDGATAGEIRKALAERDNTK